MKTLASLSLASLAAIALAGAALAEPPTADAPGHDIMRGDTNGDGKLSREEANAAHTQRADERFTRLDLDKDGFVTTEELKQAKETRQGGMHAKMAERFKDADGNGDGQLSLDEAQAKLPRLAERFTEIDADKNGLLTKEELRNARQRLREPRT
jgi:Ca2+-binding EF-hand superfamily protein